VLWGKQACMGIAHGRRGSLRRGELNHCFGGASGYKRQTNIARDDAPWDSKRQSAIIPRPPMHQGSRILFGGAKQSLTAVQSFRVRPRVLPNQSGSFCLALFWQGVASGYVV